MINLKYKNFYLLVIAVYVIAVVVRVIVLDKASHAQAATDIAPLSTTVQDY